MAGDPREHTAECLEGFRGMGPVRIGNKASEQQQNDIYGEAVLTAEPLFTNSRASWVETKRCSRVELFGHNAVKLHDVPDAGYGSFAGRQGSHVLERNVLGSVRQARKVRGSPEPGRARGVLAAPRGQHSQCHYSSIVERELSAFTATMEGDSLDASLLLMPRLGFCAQTIRDSFRPSRRSSASSSTENSSTANLSATTSASRERISRLHVWYMEALAAMGGGRREEARALYEKVLSARNRHGLLAKDLDPRTLDQWGNFRRPIAWPALLTAR